MKEKPAALAENKRETGRLIDTVTHVIRIITVPPVLVSALLILLYVLDESVFTTLSELICSLLFLVLIPITAYPVSYVVPRVRKKGREGQRKLAFALNFAGYTGVVIYGVVSQVSPSLLLIFLTYFLSVLMLILFNNILKIRASGHACSTMGPLVFLIYFTGLYGVAPCILIAAAVVWSSLHLKRHSVNELVLGALTAMIAFALAWLLMWLV